ncbi:hypothetical protein DFH06DRAFT_1338696 [Mycena polygramma]|nr:hypothetical protein DFH06DRAFT_1338696 [Mycena polygramma]
MDGLVSPIKACDNIEVVLGLFSSIALERLTLGQCDTIAQNVHFRRCSGCRNSYYCSYECQKFDWRTGGHREHCTRREPALQRFLRDALLTADYEAAKYSTIYPQKVRFMAAHPDEQFFTLFDYTAGAVHIEVLPIAGEFAQSRFGWDAEWRHDVERAVRSGGRMQLDVMIIAAGDRVQYLVVPLRQRAHAHETLKRLAVESPFARDPLDLLWLIEQLSDSTLQPQLDGLQIH